MLFLNGMVMVFLVAMGFAASASIAASVTIIEVFCVGNEG